MLGLIPVNLGRFVGETEDATPGPSFKWRGFFTPGPLVKTISCHAQQDSDAHWAHESCRAIDGSSNANNGASSVKMPPIVCKGLPLIDHHFSKSV